MLRKSVTQQYPEVKPALPPRSRGVIALVEENCTSCMLCARECPDWCIYIDSHKETIPAPEGGRARQRNVLDRFAIDFSLCMYCGICIEVCPFDALFWSPEFEYAEGDIRNLLHEKDKLAAWTPTVPPPPAHDPGAELPKERTAAPRRPARTRTPADQESPKPTAEPSPAAGTEPPASAPEAAPATPPSRPRRPMTNVRGIRPPGALPPSSEGDAAPTGPESPAADNDPGKTSTADQPQSDERERRPQPSDEDQPEGGREDQGRPQLQSEQAPGDEPLQPSGDERAQSSDDRRPSDEDQRHGPTDPQDPQEAQDPQGPGRQPQSESESESRLQTLPQGQDQGEPSSTGQPPSDELSTASDEPQPRPDPEEQTSAASPRRHRMADPRSIRPPGRLSPDETRESEEES
ncbi:4Fe-4S binding protein [Nonomuraea insulae]|uniref:4Fe-4S binding protein n=1 Tax=Nonomuraea insulae TaxID=1616787 RepID=A0ABW1D8X7_9ACTN